MTKETLIKSAIKLLVNEQVKQGSWGYALEEDSAYEVSWKDVLKWLEQQPNEDYISRQTAIDTLWKALYEYEDKTEKQFIDSEELDIADWFQHRVFVQNMSDIDRQTILDMPSVTPQQKVGEWDILGDIWQCSRCENMVMGYDGLNYCPKCGAKMEVSE